MSGPDYRVDPDDPRAPPQEVWDAMSAEERARVVAALPSEFPRAHPPEGDRHRLQKERAREALDEHFRRWRRGVYLGSELPVYYPDEPVFAPDLIAVLDVDTHPRDRWVVAQEGRGLDFVLEIHLSGDRDKDFERNVRRFARLEIPEYFAFDVGRQRLVGYRLGDVADYQPIVPQAGRWPSAVLDLDLGIEDGAPRFFVGAAPLPFAAELRERLGAMVDQAVARAEAEAARAEAEAARADRLAAKLRELGVDPDEL